jgi:hypothetical protein
MLTIVARQDLVPRPFDTDTLPMHFSQWAISSMGPEEFRRGIEIRWGVSEFKERPETTIWKMRQETVTEFEENMEGSYDYSQYEVMDLDGYVSEVDED